MVIGDWLSTVRAERTEVTQPGNEEWGFQAIAHFPNEHGVMVQVIHVQHFTPGEVKPFVASSQGGVGVATGTCMQR